MQRFNTNYNKKSNPNSSHSNNNMMVSPSQPYRPQFYPGGDGGSSVDHTDPREVTPCAPGFSIEQRLMAVRRMRAERVAEENARRYISAVERAEVAQAVYCILRDNLPPALESQTSPADLTSIAQSIESKLYATAPSPRAYMAFSTLEFRITALATAVLIHSDKAKNSNNSSGGVSEECARLSTAARKSLVYCVMVLVSYELKNLNGESSSKDNNSPVDQQSRSRNMNIMMGSSNRRGNTAMGREAVAADLQRLRQLEQYEKQKQQQQQGAETSNFYDKTPPTQYTNRQSLKHPSSAASQDDVSEVNLQIVVEEGNKLHNPPFPPSA